MYVLASEEKIFTGLKSISSSESLFFFNHEQVMSFLNFLLLLLLYLLRLLYGFSFSVC